MLSLITSLISSVVPTSTEQTQTQAQTPSQSQGVPNPFAGVEEKTTISDVLDEDKASEALPGSWSVKFEIEKADQCEITELVRIINDNHSMKFYLKPANTYNPSGKTEVIRNLHQVNKHSFGTHHCFEKAFRSVNKRVRSFPISEIKTEQEQEQEETTPDHQPSTAFDEKATTATPVEPTQAGAATVSSQN